LLFGLFIVNVLANYFYWYQSFTSFDRLMHFTGGIVGSLFLAWLFHDKYLKLLREKNLKKLFIFNTLVFLAAAGLWEVMEFSVQGIFGLDHLLANPMDSVDDLILGVLGSLVGLTYFLNKVRSLKILKNGN
jgi:uncharacterized membrane protein YjdF